MRVKRARLSLRAEVPGLARRVVRTWRPVHAVRTWLALGTVRARLARRAWLTVTARPGETSGGGVPRRRRISGNGAVSRHRTGGSARSRESSRPESPGCRSTGSWASRRWSAGSGEAALARERARTGKRITGRGTSVARERAIRGEVSGAGERTLGRVRVLGRAGRVSVRRAVAWSAASRAGRGLTGGVLSSRRAAIVALGRDDQAAWRVDGGRGQDPIPIGVDVANRSGVALRPVGAGKRTLARVGGGRARPRTDVAASPPGTRCQRSRPVRAGRAVLRRAELPARRRLAGQDARTELPRLGKLPRWGERSRSGERPRRCELSRGRRPAVGHPRAGHELARR